MVALELDRKYRGKICRSVTLTELSRGILSTLRILPVFCTPCNFKYLVNSLMVTTHRIFPDEKIVSCENVLTHDGLRKVR